MSELKAFDVIINDDYKTKCYMKADADKVIAELEEKYKKEVDRLLMKIAGLEKLVETADKLLKQRGGFMIKDVTFDGVKLEGMKNERND